MHSLVKYSNKLVSIVLIIQEVSLLVSFCGLKENIDLGRHVLLDTRKAYPYGFLSNSRYSTFSAKMNPKIEEILGEKILKMRDIVDFEKRKGHDSYEAVKYAVAKTGAANCGEQAILLSDQMNNQGIANKIVSMEIYRKNSSFPNKGHTFCLIGLDKNAKLSDPSTWGKDAVAVDLWSNSVEQAQKALRNFFKMFGYDKKKNDIKFFSVFI